MAVRLWGRALPAALTAQLRLFAEIGFAQLQRATTGHILAPAAIVLRGAFLLELFWRLISRPDLGQGLRLPFWGAGVALYTIYFLLLGVLAWRNFPSLLTTRSIRLQVGLDLAFVSFFFLVNDDPESTLVLVTLLPLLLVARYCAPATALKLLLGVCGLLVILPLGVWAIRAILGIEQPGLPSWGLYVGPSMRHAPARAWLIHTAILLVATLPMVRARYLGLKVESQGEQLRKHQREYQHRLQSMSTGVVRLAASQNIDELATMALESARSEIRCETVALFIYRDGRYHRYRSLGVPPDWYTDESYAAGEGITGQAGVGPALAEFGEGRCERDVARSPLARPENVARYVEHLGTGQVEHMIAVPLNGANRTFGILRAINKLAADDSLDPSGFTADDLDRLATIANLFALAYSLARRADKAQAVFHVHATLARTFDESQICQAIAEEIVRVGYRACCVLLGDAHQGLRVEAVHGLPIETLNLLGSLAGLSAGRLEVLLSRKPSGSYDLTTLALPGSTAWLETVGLRTVHHIPLTLDDEVVGMLEIYAAVEHRLFDDELHTLQLVATQATAAIVNARLHVRNERQIVGLSRLADLAGVAMDCEDERQLFQEVVEKAATLLEAEDCAIFWVHPNTRTIQLRASRLHTPGAPPPPPTPVSAAPRAGLVAFVAATGQTLRFSGDDYRQHLAWNGGNPLHLRSLPSLSCGSLLFCPVTDQQGRVVGVIRAENKTGADRMAGFSDLDLGLLTLLARQLAVATEKIGRLRKLRHLYAIAETITAAGDMRDVLRRIATAAQAVTGAELVVISPYDQRRGALRPASTVILGARHEVSVATHPRDEGLTRQVLTSTQGYVVVGDFLEEPQNQSVIGALEDVRSTIAVHLRAAGASVGVLFCDYRYPRAFSAEEIGDAETFGRLAAIAIRNADLLSQAKQISEELSAIQRLTRLGLGKRELNLASVIDLVLNHICEVLGFQFCSVSFVDEAEHLIVCRGARGIAEAWLDSSRHSLASDDIQAYVVRTQQTLKVSGWHDLLDRAIYERYRHERLVRIFTPIVSHGGVIGTIEAGFEREVQSDIDNEQIDGLRLYLEQLALVIESTRVLDQAQRHRMQLERLYKITRQLVCTLPETPARRVRERAAAMVATLFGEGAGIAVIGTEADEGPPLLLAAREPQLVATLRSRAERTRRLAAHAPGAGSADRHTLSIACAPIIIGSATLGTLWVWFERARRFLPEECNLLELCAAQVAAALTNVNEHQRQLMAHVEQIQESERLYHSFIGSGLTSLTLDIEMLSKGIPGPVTPKQLERLSLMHSETRAMQRRISNLFAMRHSEAGQLILKRGPCVVGPLVRDVVDRLQQIAAAKEIGIGCQIAPDCEHERLYIDGERIADATRELIYNAIKNTDQGGKIAVTAKLSAANELLITVADTGQGIDPQHHRRIFNRRGQVQSGGKMPHQGFGLGLYFVGRIVDLHNGVVELDSTLGKGARFTIRIRLPDDDPLATMSWRTEEISALHRYSQGEPIRICRTLVNAAAPVDEATVRFRVLAEERGLQLTTEIDPAVTAAELWVDHEHLRGALEELICNAVKFTPAGGSVTVRAASARNSIQYIVSDTGPGVPAERQSAIFEPGFRLAPAAHVVTSGLGLGLSYARMVARLHNGALSFSGHPGQGAALLLSLPLNPNELDSDSGTPHKLSVSAP
jgi:signal transduction histidine kinase